MSIVRPAASVRRNSGEKWRPSANRSSAAATPRIRDSAHPTLSPKSVFYSLQDKGQTKLKEGNERKCTNVYFQTAQSDPACCLQVLEGTTTTCFKFSLFLSTLSFITSAPTLLTLKIWWMSPLPIISIKIVKDSSRGRRSARLGRARLNCNFANCNALAGCFGGHVQVMSVFRGRRLANFWRKEGRLRDLSNINFDRGWVKNHKI